MFVCAFFAKCFFIYGFCVTQTVDLYTVLSMHQFFYICVFNCRVGGGGGGELGLCRPRVISRDQASLMSSGPSRGTQASYTALPTPSSLSLGTFRLHTAPCWQIWPQHDIKIVLPWPPHSQVVIWYNIFIHSFFLILV